MKINEVCPFCRSNKVRDLELSDAQYIEKHWYNDVKIRHTYKRQQWICDNCYQWFTASSYVYEPSIATRIK